MSTKFLSPGWRMPRNANQSKSSNYSLHQPGQADYIETDYSINGLTQITVSCWIKTTTNQPNEHIWSFPKAGSGSGLGLQFGSSANTGYSVTNYAMSGFPSVTDTSSVYNDGNWHNIIFTSSLTEMKLYVDGFLINTTSITATAMSGTIDKFFIGSFSNTSPQFNAYNISFSDVCIFDYALSPSQVTTLWGGGAEVSNPMALPSSPIAYYPLGGSAGAFRTPVNVNDQWLIENNAIGDYVFDFDTDLIKVEQSSAINISGNLTLSAWVYIEDSTWNPVISKSTDANNRNYEFAIRPTTRTISFYTNNGSYETTTTSLAVSLNTWTHIVISCESGVTNGTKFYFNNALDTTTGTHTITADTADLYLGTTAWNSFVNYFNGKISNAQIFNTSLSGPEVETLYNYGSPIQTLANIPQNSNLKAWYKLDASEIYNSTSTEWSVDNNQNPSAYPSSLNFDGSNDYIDCGNDSSLQLTSSFTLSTWVKLTSLSDGVGAAIIAKGTVGGSDRSVALYLFNSGGQFRVSFALSSDGSSQTLNASSAYGSILAETWHNITATFNGSTEGKVYINGIIADTATVSAFTPRTTNSNLRIGLDASNSFDLNGKTSNVQIFNTVLPETGSNSIETLYNNGTPLADMSSFSSLVSWWKLNNTTTGIEDSKGTNNGTNNGATEYPGFVNALAGESSGMSQSNLVQSDLQTVAPYSKYALAFDGVNDFIRIKPIISTNNVAGGIVLANNFTVSYWIKLTSSANNKGAINGQVNSDGIISFFRFAIIKNGQQNLYINTTYVPVTPVIDNGDWYNIIYCNSYDNTELKVYTNNSLTYENTTHNFGRGNNIGNIARAEISSITIPMQMSNLSVWNKQLSSSEVSEIYNQGVPSNLNNHSAYSNLVSWWQLGENSSFASNWICADEKGSNNGTSSNMGENALTNGVGTTANGVSSGMSEGSLVGDAPYSTGNAISSGMAVTARGTDVPPTP